ncbi:metallophosphoesterase family protein [Cyclobacterium xiamenense]|uniref:metallophosphoesterase family protein n=1 Tax=Cyclobacterium xiamenense TaxID=1297121 RepID=UPI0012B9A288|nr:DNA repair exonuclease [Cyclobacterium xiamenense]
MKTTFIHSADWQIGKPFASLSDPTKQVNLSNLRLQAILKIGEIASEEGVDFVVVAGDLWDSVTPTKALVSETLQAIGKIPVPVYVIPGNHDHAAPGTVWHQAYYRQEQQALAPNLQLLLEAKPIELDQAILLPCPLLRNKENTDLSQWLRDASIYTGLGDKPRIVLAHGSVADFGAEKFEDEEEFGSSAANLLDLSRLPLDDNLDYLALGDWHGTKKINDKSWYSGTPEPDRFPKGERHDQGNILLVTAERGIIPTVQRLNTSSASWQVQSFHFTSDTAFPEFESAMNVWVGNRVNQDLLKLELTGSLGLEAMDRLQKSLETYQSRLIRIKLANRVLLEPREEELDQLRIASQDPLIARVADKLNFIIQKGGVEETVAREALKQLYFTSKAL